MTFPPDRAMLSLASLSHASGGRYTPDGRTFARVQITDEAANLWEIRPAELDELERQGWVALLPPGPEDKPESALVRVTEAGRYWLTRWLQTNRARVRQLIDQHYPRG